MAVIDTIKTAVSLVTSGATAMAAAQRLGMHLVDEKLQITFTPRDREFVTGSAVRVADKANLALIDFEVAPETTIRFSALRDAFGPFKAAPRIHPDDDREFVAQHRRDGSTWSIAVTLRSDTMTPTGDEAVATIEVAP